MRDTNESPHIDVLVIGGGVAGLRCATALSAAGLRVHVLERRACAGGRAGSVVEPMTGLQIDHGPHVLLSDYRNLLGWLRELGTAGQVGWQRQPLINLLDARGLLPVPASALPPPLHGLPGLPHLLSRLSARDLWSNRRVAWHALRLDAAGTLALDGEPAERWLRAQGVSAHSLCWFWSSAAMALLNLPLAECSTASLMRLCRLMLGRSGYCFGLPRVALAELFVPPSRRTIERAGGALLTGTHVARLLTDGSGPVHAETADGRRFTARAAVLALPPAALAALDLPGWHPPDGLQAAAARFDPSPYVSTYLWLDRRVTDLKFWARIWAPQHLNLDFYDLANVRGMAADAPSVIAANAIHATGDGLDDAEIVGRTHAELACLGPAAAASRVRHAVVHRIPMAIPCPRPGTESLRPPVATPAPHLWLAADWTDTGLPCSMESAARAGALAAERAAAFFGRRLQLAEPVPETVGLPGWLRRHWPWHPPRGR